MIRMPSPFYKWGVYAFGIALAILLADLLFLSFKVGCDQPPARPVGCWLFGGNCTWRANNKQGGAQLMNSTDANRIRDDAPENEFDVLSELTQAEKRELLDWWKKQHQNS